MAFPGFPLKAPRQLRGRAGGSSHGCGAGLWTALWGGGPGPGGLVPWLRGKENHRKTIGNTIGKWVISMEFHEFHGDFSLGTFEISNFSWWLEQEPLGFGENDGETVVFQDDPVRMISPKIGELSTHTQIYLVGGLEHGFYFSIISGNNTPNWLIFFRGVETTNQMGLYYYL